jgi:hypothetical protein
VALAVTLEVLDLALGVWDDGVAAGCPVGRTNLSVLIGKLESLHKSQSFVNRSGRIQKNKF